MSELIGPETILCPPYCHAASDVVLAMPALIARILRGVRQGT